MSDHVLDLDMESASQVTRQMKEARNSGRSPRRSRSLCPACSIPIAVQLRPTFGSSWSSGSGWSGAKVL